MFITQGQKYKKKVRGCSHSNKDKNKPTKFIDHGQNSCV